jgi:nicotinamidase-related amidase
LDVQQVIVGKPALIVVDMQKGGFLPTEVSGIPHMDGYAERIARVNELIGACRTSGVPIVFFQEAHRRDLVDFGRELDGVESVHCLEGDPGTEIVDELTPLPTDYRIVKRRYSCFFATDLEILLKGLGVDTLLLVGGLTDVCVHYTFVDAHQRDFHVRVLEDCVGGSSVPAHDAALNAMEYLQTGARIRVAHVLHALAVAA